MFYDLIIFCYLFYFYSKLYFLDLLNSILNLKIKLLFFSFQILNDSIFQVTKYESEQKCHTVQDKVERQVPRQVCNQVTRQACRQVPVTKTEYRSETSCNTVTEQRCTKVSKKTCNYH